MNRLLSLVHPTRVLDLNSRPVHVQLWTKRDRTYYKEEFMPVLKSLGYLSRFRAVVVVLHLISVLWASPGMLYVVVVPLWAYRVAYEAWVWPVWAGVLFAFVGVLFSVVVALAPFYCTSAKWMRMAYRVKRGRCGACCRVLRPALSDDEQHVDLECVDCPATWRVPAVMYAQHAL
ncbi:MAG: hypothetical protein AAGI53_15000 [Planctomycetota bacterium]